MAYVGGVLASYLFGNAMPNSTHGPPARRHQLGHLQLHHLGTVWSRSDAREAESIPADVGGGGGPLVPHAGRRPWPSPVLRKLSREPPVLHGAAVALGRLAVLAGMSMDGWIVT